MRRDEKQRKPKLRLWPSEILTRTTRAGNERGDAHRGWTTTAMLATRLRTPALRHLTRAASSSSASSSSVPAETPKGNSPGTVAGSQSPNYPTQWSLNQRARPTPTDGARFEQTILELQPQPLSAMAMIAEEPVRIVKGRKAVCDGGALWWTWLHTLSCGAYRKCVPLAS